MSKIQNGVVSTLPALSVPEPLQQAIGVYDYVLYGSTNLYPQYVADLFTLSPTHQSIIESKRNFLNGNLIIDAPGESLDFEDINGKGDNLEEFVDEINSNLATYESMYIEYIYNSTKTRIVQLNVIPYEYVRVGKYNEEGVMDTIYVSPDWSRKYIKKNKPRALAIFNKDKIDTDSQVAIFRVKRPNQPYYTIPSYMSAVQWILLEDDIAELNRNDVTNGFFPSMIMNFFNGDPTDDDKEELETYINSKFKGARGNKLMMFFSSEVDKKVQIDTFTPPNLGEYTEKLIPLLRSEILSSHRANPSLVGISTSSGFSNKADELEAAYQLYIKNSIIPLQKLTINMFRKVYKFNEIEADIMFENELVNKDNEDNANAETNEGEEVIVEPKIEEENED